EQCLRQLVLPELGGDVRSRRLVREEDLHGLEAVRGGGAEALQERHLLVDPGEIGGELGHCWFRWLIVVPSEAARSAAQSRDPLSTIECLVVERRSLHAALRALVGTTSWLTTERLPRPRAPARRSAGGP